METSTPVRSAVVLDDIDRAVIHALEIDGRAPFARIAGVVGVSEQTVARRYRRLRGSGVARVVGLANPRRLGLTTWVVRIRSTPDAAFAIAEALARRPDTSWVELTSGGTEISCVARLRGTADADHLLRHTLPRTPKVVDITAQCVLHIAHGGPLSWREKAAWLTPDQVAALDPGYGLWNLADDGEPTTVEPTEADVRLLAQLGRDGRSGYAELASATGQSESWARRRLDELRRERLLFFELDADPAALGHRTTAALRMSVPPTHLAEVLAELSLHPEVVFAAATTGATNVIAVACLRDEAELYRYLTTRIAALTRVTSVETTTVFRLLKREGAILTAPRRPGGGGGAAG
ncbi:Lrp/AsnC family transcriptional regulator [Yinghuangia sp. YIM S09857]|uniref:Lrp/AsnC family transcriptional regulator n=1 Tax=Yinghuangia sp. YIM S09857 TaxID=3436929 RepID=UPI003F534DE5